MEPWRANGSAVESDDPLTGQTFVIASTHAYEERDADRDARLIAAAPDLRNVVEMLLMFHSGGEWSDEKRARWDELGGGREATTRSLCDIARAAIAKAEGR